MSSGGARRKRQGRCYRSQITGLWHLDRALAYQQAPWYTQPGTGGAKDSARRRRAVCALGRSDTFVCLDLLAFGDRDHAPQLCRSSHEDKAAHGPNRSHTQGCNEGRCGARTRAWHRTRKPRPLKAFPVVGASAARTVSGVVYESGAGEPHRAGLPGVAGVLVSNGREVVRTDAQGRYTLPDRRRSGDLRHQAARAIAYPSIR